jgi:glyoxylase-like metal-dependent hydrolase (beta-lactamase superfamily II)
MTEVNKIFENSDLLVVYLSVGPLDNNVYIIQCKHTGKALLIDAANEHEKLKQLVEKFRIRQVVETHGHFDHIGAVTELRESGCLIKVSYEDSSMLPSYDLLLKDDEIIPVGKAQLRVIHTPGHTPGSLCFELLGTNLLFTGDTLFPGGPGATHFPGGDFNQIINSITQRLFTFPPDTLVLPGHGKFTTIGQEAPHLQEWVDRGW